MAKKKGNSSKTSKMENSNSVEKSISIEDNKKQKTDETNVQQEVVRKEEKIEIQQVIKSVIESLGKQPPENAEKIRNEIIRKYLAQIVSNHKIAEEYNLLILYDEGKMIKSDADKIYSAATKFKEKKSLLLVLYSSGGVIDSAYLIGKLCREYSNGKLVIVVPRQAKSAASLICCAADEIHMGSLSELGPIDPQIDRLPALGLKNSIEHIAELIQRYPKSSDMFAKYLNLSLEPIHIGYYERVAESAVQYAERLLKSHESGLINSAEKISNELVYSYKDHGFVIDKSEAKEIFGDTVIKVNTPEYNLANSIYETMIVFSQIADILNYYFYFIGACDSLPNFNKKK